MKNLSSSFKKFLGNKNTVTIIGVLLVILILYIGYNYRVNQAVSLSEVPVAKETIGPKTEITRNMISWTNVPAEFLKGTYFSNEGDIIGKYTNYNSTIVAGSLFYTELLVKAEDLPDSIYADLPKGYRVATLSLSSVRGLYGGPGEYIDIYFSGINGDGKIMFGEFLSGLEILGIVDANGNNTYGAVGEEIGAPTTMYIAVPEDLYIMFGRLERINQVVANLNSYLVLTPHQTSPDVDNVDIYLTSDNIRDLINDNAQEIDKIEEKLTPETE